MLESHLIIYFLLAVIQFLFGTFTNGIIVVVNGIDLIKHRKMAPLDLLLSCLAVSRIFLQLFIFYINVVVIFLMEFITCSANCVFLIFVNELELWLATWLGVFYCAKVASVPHPLFIWLKMRISKLVPWMILGSLLYVSMICIFHSKYTGLMVPYFLRNFFFQNATIQTEVKQGIQVFSFVAELLVPLLIFLVAVLLLIFSLGRHSRQMRNTVAGSRVPGRGAHISALLSILSFLILYISHYLIKTFLSSLKFHVKRSIFLFCILVIGTYPSGHSLILILGNPKLKQNTKKFLCHSKCCQ
ncbi:taste receptor type 2 member 1 [Trachypithecus francoisi]|uniref:taste receptor type 2 member 1 n=1 Tax=Trachypithecus francoisi TaxID=54180 RepID=UPI00141A7B05|nr:taste receptor type 2 member 1 [Trachypithecus francoisi]